MAGIQQIRQQQAQWKSEGKISEGGNDRLFMGNGDIAFFYFMSSGADDDPYFEQYMAHEYPPVEGTMRKQLRLCPVLSGFDMNYPCQGCLADVKAKPQMAMWMLVSDVLRKTKREQDQFPVVAHQGESMFHQKVEGLRLWDTSAWRDSPISDIVFIYDSLQDLRGARCQLNSSGDGMSRRYKIYAVPGSPALEPEVWKQFAGQAKPVRQYLMDRLGSVPTAAVTAADFNGAAQPAPVPFVPAFTGVAQPDLAPLTDSSDAPPEERATIVNTPVPVPAAASSTPVVPPGGAKSLF